MARLFKVPTSYTKMWISPWNRRGSTRLCGHGWKRPQVSLAAHVISKPQFSPTGLNVPTLGMLPQYSAPADAAADVSALSSLQLDAEQQQAVFTEGQHVRVIAGPGSGKTRVVTARISRLLAEGVEPWRIMAVTFTNKAAEELKTRIWDTVGGDQSRGVVTGTFHSLCAWLLRRHIEKLRLLHTSDFIIYDIDDSEEVLKEVLKGVKVGDVAMEVDVCQFCISRAKSRTDTWYNKKAEDVIQKLVEEGVDPFTALTADECQYVAKCMEQYNRALEQRNALDFDDLLSLMVAVLRECSDVRSYMHGRWQHILVDEFQDTNTPQYQLVRLMAGPRTCVFTVGDPNQGVYSWRGADINNIQKQFQVDFKSDDVLHLSSNYRSYRNIVEAAEAVLCADGPPPLFKASAPTRVSSKEPAVVVNRSRNDMQEGGWLAKEILQLNSRGWKFKDIAVLFRTWSLSTSVEKAFVEHGIPYFLVGGKDYWSRKEVKDAMAFLRIIHNPGDCAALERIVNVPARGIGERTQQKLRTWCDQQDSHIAEVMLNNCVSSTLQLPQLINILKQLDTGQTEVTSLKLADYDPLPKDIPYKDLGIGRLPASGLKQLRALVYLGRCVAQYLPVSAVIDFSLGLTGYADMLKKEEGKHDQEAKEPPAKSPKRKSKGPNRQVHLTVLRSITTDTHLDGVILGYDRVDRMMAGRGELVSGPEDQDATGKAVLPSGEDQPSDDALSSTAVAAESSQLQDVPVEGWDTLHQEDESQLGLRSVIGQLQEVMRGPAEVDSLGRELRLSRLGRFLEWHALSKGESESSEDSGHFRSASSGEGVGMMTLHAAKGKEFRAVIIVGCEEGRLPLRRSNAEEKGPAHKGDEEEERRLMYVGMTRARDRLYLSYSRERQLFGKSSSRGPSPYLQHIKSGALQANKQPAEEGLKTAAKVPKHEPPRVTLPGHPVMPPPGRGGLANSIVSLPPGLGRNGRPQLPVTTRSNAMKQPTSHPPRSALPAPHVGSHPQVQHIGFQHKVHYPPPARPHTVHPPPAGPWGLRSSYRGSQPSQARAPYPHNNRPASPPLAAPNPKVQLRRAVLKPHPSSVNQRASAHPPTKQDHLPPGPPGHMA